MQKNTPSSNPPWGIIDAIIVLLFINLFAFVFKILGREWLIIILGKLPGGRSELNQLLITSIIQTGLFLILIYYFVFMKYKSNIKSLGLVKTRLKHWLKVGFINGFILFFIVLVLGILLNWLLPIDIKPQPIAKVIMSARTKWEMMIPFFVTAVSAPLSEELYFRGFLYPALRRRIGIKWGILVTSVIFGSLHYDLIRAIPLIFGGIWLNVLYEKSGSIYTSMIAHSVWNSIMTILIFIMPQAV